MATTLQVLDCLTCQDVFSPKCVVSCASCQTNLTTKTDFERHFGQDLTCLVVNSSKFESDPRVEPEDLFEEDSGDFRCQTCDRTFFSAIELMDHVGQTHVKGEDEPLVGDPSTGYSCDFCSQMCDSVDKLESHLKEEHQNVRYFCQRCFEPFLQDQTLAKHICPSQNESVICPHCQACFSNLDCFKEHVAEVGDDHPGLLTCQQCSVIFANPSQMSKHERACHEERTVSCSECCKVFSHPRLLRKHFSYFHRGKKKNCHQCFKSLPVLGEQSHLDNDCPGEIPKNCPICDAKMTNIAQLRSHVKDRHPDDDFDRCWCKVCDQIISHLSPELSKSHLERHMSKDDELDMLQQGQPPKVTSIPKQGSKLCQYCDDVLKSSESFESHVIEHHPEKLGQHQCDICNKFFVLLRNHRNTVHSNEVATCEICGKTLKNSRILQEHKKWIHMKETLKKHKCSFCPYEDPRKFVVDKHVQTVHRGVKSFVCNSCGKSFSQRGNLDKHVKAIHLQFKPNVCHVCGRHFSRNGQLEEHIKRVHMGIKNVKCSTCCRHYPSKESLDRHLAKGCDGKKRKSRAKSARQVL